MGISVKLFLLPIMDLVPPCFGPFTSRGFYKMIDELLTYSLKYKEPWDFIICMVLVFSFGMSVIIIISGVIIFISLYAEWVFYFVGFGISCFALYHVVKFLRYARK